MPRVWTVRVRGCAAAADCGWREGSGGSGRQAVGYAERDVAEVSVDVAKVTVKAARSPATLVRGGHGVME